jgi:glucosamine-6-phosphate deaminase
MPFQHSPRATIYPDARAAARALASRIASELAENPRLVLGLPTGRTPIALYDELSRRRPDFSQATTFNLDEFLGIPPTHPGSFREFMEQHLFRKVNINRDRIHFLDGSVPDPDAECTRYERAIEEAGGLDLQVIGIGTNGHIGFNEPARELQPRTHRVALLPETKRSNAAWFGGDPAKVPAEALSMGMATILQAKRIVLLATGRSKASCIERVLHGPVTPELPGSFLQLHRDVDILVDEAAAEKLKRRG